MEDDDVIAKHLAKHPSPKPKTLWVKIVPAQHSLIVDVRRQPGLKPLNKK